MCLNITDLKNNINIINNNNNKLGQKTPISDKTRMQVPHLTLHTALDTTNVTAFPKPSLLLSNSSCLPASPLPSQRSPVAGLELLLLPPLLPKCWDYSKVISFLALPPPQPRLPLS